MNIPQNLLKNPVQDKNVEGKTFAYKGSKYDSYPLANGAFTGERRFFSDNQNKTRSMTNMDSPGQLSKGESMKVFSLKLGVTGFSAAGVDLTLIQLLSTQAYVQFFRNQRLMTELPLLAVPIDYPVMLPQQKQTAAANAYFPAYSGVKGTPDGYKFDLPIQLAENMNFSVRITWETSVTLANMATDARLYCILHGIIYRDT